MCKWPGSQVQVQYCQQLDIAQQGQGLQFLAVQNSSIGDLVTNSLTDWLTDWPFDFDIQKTIK